MIGAGKRPVSALHRYTDHLSTEFAKNFLHRDGMEGEMFQNQQPVRLSRKKIPKHSYKSSTNVTLHQEKEQLYSESLNLKQRYHEVANENTRLRTRIQGLEKELARKNKMIMNRNEPVVNRESTSGYKQIEATSTLTTNLKALLQEEKGKYERLSEECEELKRSVKYTKIVELELQLKAFEEETIRLKGILAEVDFTKLNEKQSFKKLSRLEKKFKTKQEENIALLEINLKYQDKMKETLKESKTQEQESKSREMKLISELESVKKRLALSLKTKQMLDARNKKEKALLNQQNPYKDQKKGDKNGLFERNSTSKQGNRDSLNHPNRPLTASNKINRIQFHRYEMVPSNQNPHKSSSQYENIYDYQDQFQEQPQSQQDLSNNKYRMNGPNKINTIIEEEESFNEYDQLCYLITYRFLAQGWDYAKFVESANRQYSKNINVQEIQAIVQNQPFYLQQAQAQFLIKYLFEAHSLSQVRPTTLHEFLTLIKTVIYSFTPFTDTQIKQTRLKFLHQYLSNTQQWAQFFSFKNGFIHHNDFHSMLSSHNFMDEQTQQIIAELSLFVYDLTQFSMEAVQKYVNTLEENNGKIRDPIE